MRRVTRTIRSLKPNVGREEASQYFTGGPRGLVAGLLRGRAQSMAELHIPFHLFQVKITNSGRCESRFFALDAVEGVLDLYEFPRLPNEQQLISLQTRNALPSLLPVERAHERLLSKVRRVVFSRGFIRLRNLQLEASAIAGEVYVPYWVCFRGSDQMVKFEILDAVRRKPEGGKLRHLVENWLRTSSASGTTMGFEDR